MIRKLQPAYRRVFKVLLPAMLVAVLPAFAQYPAQYAAPLQPPAQLDNLVNRIALYPDPLLAQILTAATYPDQIQDAARFAAANRSLQGDALANAMAQANLPFDASVQSLIPFPDVLDMMARDMNWTAALGNAVLQQRADVMDSVQRMRRLAQNYGYLQSNQQEQVYVDPSYISIVPADPSCVYVPYYDPFVVFAAPRPGFFVGGAVAFRTGYVIGPRFNTWGWGGGFNWASHSFNNGQRRPFAYTSSARPVTINRSITVNRNSQENVSRFVNRTPVQANSFAAPQQHFAAPQVARPMARPMEPRPQPQARQMSQSRGGHRER